MDQLDIQLLQRRVIDLIGRVTLLTQDVGTLRERLETVAATVDVQGESLRAHVDQGFAKVEDSNARVIALLENLVRR